MWGGVKAISNKGFMGRAPDRGRGKGPFLDKRNLVKMRET